jgi:hypothetical protein
VLFFFSQNSMMQQATTFFHIFLFINKECLDAFQSAVLSYPTSCLKNDNMKQSAKFETTLPDRNGVFSTGVRSLMNVGGFLKCPYCFHF